ncbi:MAG: 1-acyl-sn-glycerol-3-phosphate acyltransferase [Bacilli bacterium]|nr:1-acyl-sn-glycerol-3-phosphate acyltransferase [Bacilli bacterium]
MLFEIITLLSATALTIHGLTSFWPVHNWYDFYRPLVLAIGGYLLGLLLVILWLAIITTFINKEKEYNKVNKWSRFWFTTGLQYINAHSLALPKFKGLEKLPKNERYLLVCNHKSRFDSMIISEHLAKQDIAFITKRSNEKIPWGGKLFKTLCYLSIDRDDKLQSLTQFKKASNYLTNGICNIGVFPEGTRKDEDVILGDFHEGVFNIALKSQKPIVIITSKNTPNIHKNFPFKFTKVMFEVVGVIPYEEISDKPAIEVSNMVHQIMYENLTK